MTRFPKTSSEGTGSMTVHEPVKLDVSFTPIIDFLHIHDQHYHRTSRLCVHPLTEDIDSNSIEVEPLIFSPLKMAFSFLNKTSYLSIRASGGKEGGEIHPWHHFLGRPGTGGGPQVAVKPPFGSDVPQTSTVFSSSKCHD